MYGSEIASKLAEIKRLSTLAAAIAPPRNKSDRPDLSQKELEMIEDLLNRLKALASEVVDGIATQMKDAEEFKKMGGLGPVAQDVLSALLNLGCSRPQAEAAVRKARDGGTAIEFEPLFRRALEL